MSNDGEDFRAGFLVLLLCGLFLVAWYACLVLVMQLLGFNVGDSR